MLAIAQLNTNGILRRTQRKDHIESFYAKTFDNRPVCLDVYEKAGEKWFVFLAPPIVAWTTDQTMAFAILRNVSAYKINELVQVQQQKESLLK